MPAPTFVMPTTGTDPKRATLEDLRDGINAPLASLYDDIVAVDEKTGALGDRVAEVEGLAISGVNRKAAVACATTANITLSGEQTIDGATTSASRVLVKNQSTPAQNGIYVSSSGAWSRASDMNEAGEVQGAAVYVTVGAANAGKTFYTGSDVTTLGTDAIAWVVSEDQTALQAKIDATDTALNSIADRDTATVRFGLPSGVTPVSANSSPDETHVFAQTAVTFGLLTAVTAYFSALVPIVLKVLDGSGAVRAEATVTATASGLQTIAVPDPLLVRPGDIVGWYAGTRVGYQLATSDSGGIYSASGDASSVTVSGSPSTGARYQISLIVEDMDLATRGYVSGEIGGNYKSVGEATGTGSWTGAVPENRLDAYPALLSGSIQEVRVNVHTVGNGTLKLELRDPANGYALLEEATVSGMISGYNVIPASEFAEWADHDNAMLFIGGGTGMARLTFSTASGSTIYISSGSGATATITTTGSAFIGMEVDAGERSLSDRIDRTNGTVKTVNDLKDGVSFKHGDVWNFHATHGQSNGQGFNDITTYLSASPTHKTFNTGLRSLGSAVLSGNGGVTNDGAVKALVEQTDAGATYGNTGLHQSAIEITAARAQDNDTAAVLFCAALGKSGTAIASIGVGSQWHKFNVIANLDLAKAAAEAAGKQFVIAGFDFRHGETDNQNGTSKAVYYARMNLLIDTINEYAAALPAQTHLPYFLFTTTNCLQSAATLGTGQLEAVQQICRERDNCRLVEPTYIYPYVDAAHYSDKGLLAKQVAAELLRWERGLCPGGLVLRSAVYDADNARAIVYARGKSAARLLTTHPKVGTVTNAGFAVVDDGTLAISGAVSIGDTTELPNGEVVTEIYLPLNGTPGSNPVIRYGKTNSGSTSGGTVKGGTVFDSDTATATVDGVTYPLARAAHPVTLTLKTLE